MYTIRIACCFALTKISPLNANTEHNSFNEILFKQCLMLEGYDLNWIQASMRWRVFWKTIPVNSHGLRSKCGQMSKHGHLPSWCSIAIPFHRMEMHALQFAASFEAILRYFWLFLGLFSVTERQSQWDDTMKLDWIKLYTFEPSAINVIVLFFLLSFY